MGGGTSTGVAALGSWLAGGVVPTGFAGAGVLAGALFDTGPATGVFAGVGGFADTGGFAAAGVFAGLLLLPGGLWFTG
jgi:hypothetical protein